MDFDETVQKLADMYEQENEQVEEGLNTHINNGKSLPQAVALYRSTMSRPQSKEHDAVLLWSGEIKTGESDKGPWQCRDVIILLPETMEAFSTTVWGERCEKADVLGQSLKVTGTVSEGVIFIKKEGFVLEDHIHSEEELAVMWAGVSESIHSAENFKLWESRIREEKREQIIIGGIITRGMRDRQTQALKGIEVFGHAVDSPMGEFWFPPFADVYSNVDEGEDIEGHYFVASVGKNTYNDETKLQPLFVNIL
jgi:hypothetical protein